MWADDLQVEILGEFAELATIREKHDLTFEQGVSAFIESEAIRKREWNRYENWLHPELVRQRRRDWSRANPDKVAVKNKRVYADWYKRLRADPVKYAARLAANAAGKRARRANNEAR